MKNRMRKKQMEIDVRDVILKHLISDDRDLGWLAHKTKIPYTTLYFIIKRKERRLTDEKRKKINEVLNTNY